MMSRFNRSAFWFPIIVGCLLIVFGIVLRTPGGALTTSSTLDGITTNYYEFDNRYSAIDEYVGGDAYNYIIGASLVSGKMAGIMTAKAICIVGGIMCACFGITFMLLVPKRDSVKDVVTESKQGFALPNDNIHAVSADNDEVGVDTVQSHDAP